MINRILNKAVHGDTLEKDEILTLFKINKEEDLKELMKTAEEIRNENFKAIKLTSTIHLTNKCQITPKCKYCGFAAKTSTDGYYNAFYKKDDEILAAAKCVDESGIPRISCSGAHGYKGKQAVNAARLVKENTKLQLLINIGSDLTEKSLQQLADYNTDTICCNLETTNNNLFNEVKPGERLSDRIDTCKMISDYGIELSSGLLIGLGESYEDRVNHLLYLNNFESLGEIPIMGFNPYADTPMANHPPCPIDEQLKTIAITRLVYPEIRITTPTPTIGPENAAHSLKAGSNNLATVIPEDYPSVVKGVGSPTYGNLNEVLKLLDSLNLKAEHN